MTTSFNLKSSNHQGFFAQFEAIVKGDDPLVKQGKPHPDIFIEAARRIARRRHPNHHPIEHLDYSKFLAFEDSPTGVTVGIVVFSCW